MEDFHLIRMQCETDPSFSGLYSAVSCSSGSIDNGSNHKFGLLLDLKLELAL